MNKKRLIIGLLAYAILTIPISFAQIQIPNVPAPSPTGICFDSQMRAVPCGSAKTPSPAPKVAIPLTNITSIEKNFNKAFNDLLKVAVKITGDYIEKIRTEIGKIFDGIKTSFSKKLKT